MRFLGLLFLLVLAVLQTQAAVLRGQPQAFSRNSDIVLRWDSDDESGVIAFEISRRAGMDGPFIVLVPRYQARGSGSHYEFVDETAFRTAMDSFYMYRIIAIYSDNHRSEPYDVGVSHTVSGVRRTWGSIKAMFR
jgi:hypothetical protein